jgi:hypothetical protein
VDSISDFYKEECIKSEKAQAEVWSWCRSFVSFGGMEKVVNILKSQVLSLSTLLTLRSKLRTANKHSTKADDELDSKINVLCLIVSQSARIVYRLLQFDENCVMWLRSPNLHFSIASLSTQILKTALGDSGSESRGCMVALCDTAALLPLLLEGMLQLSIECRLDVGSINDTVLVTYLEHCVSLSLWLCCIAENGLAIMESYANWDRLLRSLCLRIPSDAARIGVCRRLFEGCARLAVLCHHKSISSTVPSKARDLMHFFIRSILRCAHPGAVRYLRHIDDSPEEMSLGPEEYFSADAYYSLLALLWALQCAPPSALWLLIQRHTSKTLLASEDIKEERVVEMQKGEFYINGTVFNRLFAEKLFSHRSQESFHSSRSDGTLIGMLRVCC